VLHVPPVSSLKQVVVEGQAQVSEPSRMLELD